MRGVGAANREQIERVFHRGFTAMLTPSATFSMARAATLQAAADLHGTASAISVIIVAGACGIASRHEDPSPQPMGPMSHSEAVSRLTIGD